MESTEEIESDNVKNETEQTKYTGCLFNKVCDIPNGCTTAQDDLKIKVEIELKEEENGMIYQPDLYGHLRLVNLNQSVLSDYGAIDNEPEGISKWHSLESVPVSDLKEMLIVSSEQDNMFSDKSAFGQLKDVSYASPNELEVASTAGSLQHTFSEESSVVYNYAFDCLSEEQFPHSSQVNQNHKRRKRQLSCILAEKKRNYRLKIKEENPGMWCAMKQKEACKRREQREEKRLILLEMQKMMHLISLPDSPDVENHKLYLEALKDRYPDIWKQLIEALSAAEQRNQERLNEQNAKKCLSKPAKMYKDVIEAQKKYLYRQRLKLERPDLYEQQKARDSYKRSIKRSMVKKQLTESQNGMNS